MATRAKTDRQLAALAHLVTEYEAEHGEITEAELAEQQRADRDAAKAAAETRRARLE